VTRDWDATTYDRLPIPMTRWGEAVLGWLDLVGDERVLDAGCGTGQVTALLRDRLPCGAVIALDGSPSMIARARERLGHDRVEYVLADLLEPLSVEPPVDAVLSTATIHWIITRRCSPTLQPFCGPAGNSRLNVAARGTSRRSVPPCETWAWRSGRTTRAPMRPARGWRRLGSQTWKRGCTTEPTPLPEDDLEPYLEAICLGDHVEEMTPTERRAFVHEVARRMPGPVIDYVRLNIRARRAV